MGWIGRMEGGERCSRDGNGDADQTSARRVQYVIRGMTLTPSSHTIAVLSPESIGQTYRPTVGTDNTRLTAGLTAQHRRDSPAAAARIATNRQCLCGYGAMVLVRYRIVSPKTVRRTDEDGAHSRTPSTRLREFTMRIAPGSGRCRAMSGESIQHHTAGSVAPWLRGSATRHGCGVSPVCYLFVRLVRYCAAAPRA
jgi:hypothetical protein